jgi:hypothetical protein
LTSIKVSLLIVDEHDETTSTCGRAVAEAKKERAMMTMNWKKMPLSSAPELGSIVLRVVCNRWRKALFD